MLYVVAIDKEDGGTDWKVFTRSGDAIRRHTFASRFVTSREPVRIGNEETIVVACRMFRARTTDVREAVRLVEHGQAETLERRPNATKRTRIVFQETWIVFFAIRSENPGRRSRQSQELWIFSRTLRQFGL